MKKEQKYDKMPKDQVNNDFLDSEPSDVVYISEQLGRLEYENRINVKKFVDRTHFTNFINLSYNYYLCPLKFYIYQKTKKILTMTIFITVLSIIISYFYHFNEQVFEVKIISKWMIIIMIIMIVFQFIFSISSLQKRYAGYFIFKYIYNINPSVHFKNVLENIQKICLRHYNIKIEKYQILNIITFEDDIYKYLIKKHLFTNRFYTDFSEKCFKYFFPLDYNSIQNTNHNIMMKVNYCIMLGLIICSPLVCITVFISQFVDMIKAGNDFSDISIFDFTPLSKIKMRQNGVLPHIYARKLLFSKKYAILSMKEPVENILHVCRRFLVILCSTMILVLLLVLLKMLIYQRNLFNFSLDLYSLDLVFSKNKVIELKLLHIVYAIGGLFYIKRILDINRDYKKSTRKSFQKFNIILQLNERYSQTSQIYLNRILKRKLILVIKECIAPFIVPWQLLLNNKNLEKIYDVAKKSPVFVSCSNHFGKKKFNRENNNNNNHE